MEHKIDSEECYNTKGERIIKADLFKLQHGSRFYVINGDWTGTIEIEDNKHYILNAKGRFELKEHSNRTLDIEILPNVEEHKREMDNRLKQMDIRFSGVPF